MLFVFSIEVDGHWLIVFASGYLIRKLFVTERCQLCIIVFIGILTLIFTYLRIIVNDSNPNYNTWWHVFAGIFIFMLMYYILKKNNLRLTNKTQLFLDFTDKYTYDIYLTHWLYIGSYFSVLELTKYRAVNFVVFMFLMLLSAYILYAVSKFLNDKIDYCIEKLL